MSPWLWIAVAYGHGGEDHGAPAPVAAATEGARVPTWSSEFDVVVHLSDLRAGAPGHGRLLVAKHATSEPVSLGSATLALTGPADLAVTAEASEVPGEWPFEATFPSSGPWTGGVTLVTPDRADALGLPEFTLESADAGGASAPGWIWTLPLCLSLAGLLGGGLVGLLGGRLASRVLGAASIVVVVGTATRGWAHGGEDHGAPPAPVAAGAGIVLPLESQFLVGLRTAPVAEEPFVASVRGLGTTIARPGGSAELRAPVSGVVTFPPGRTLVPGETVVAGDVLATIAEALGGADRSTWVEARAQARVSLAEARQRQALAERDLARAGSLGEVLSERQRLERQAEVAVAEQQVEAATASVAALDQRGPLTTLRAPLTGRVTTLAVRPGDLVSPGDVLFRVTDAGGLWVDVTIPEAWAGRVRAGGRATVSTRGTSGERLGAVVLDPGLEADPASGTLAVVLALDEPVAWLVPGASVTTSIDIGDPRPALVVPDSAVVDGAGETLVFVKTAPERFEARPVRLGPQSGGRREVLQGLAAGERVVVDGTYTLRSLVGR